MIMNDRWIKTHSDPMLKCPLISPFRDSCPPGEISSGLSSFGYDARLSNRFMQYDHKTIDPKNPNTDNIVEFTCKDQELIIGPQDFLLGVTVEHFCIPIDVIGVCVGKSTYARAGISVICTPLEPGWKGHVTLEIVNHTDSPVKLYVNEGICQFLFFKGELPAVTYRDRNGKYQNQPMKPVLPFVIKEML